MTAFQSGRDLNAAFYADVVEPAIRRWHHAAALLGWGSDVLGYDDLRSTDHGWGPRLQVFVQPADLTAAQEAVDATLPETYRDWPVRYGWDDAPVTARVDVTTLAAWLSGQLGIDPTVELEPQQWVLIPQQHLLEVTRGAVYADPDGDLAHVRERLAWYPRDIWLWLLACQWQRIDEDEPFVGRTAEVGDELGSRLAAARQVREIMRLAFLLERRYAPYAKWFGTAFRELPVAKRLAAPLVAAVAGGEHAGREDALVEAYGLVARRHNEVLPEAAADPSVGLFHDRPFRVLGSHRFAAATFAAVADETVLGWPRCGNIDQVSDSVAVRDDVSLGRRLAALYAN